MNVQQVMGKLTEQELNSFMESKIWRSAKQRGLAWNEAVLDEQAVYDALSLLSEYAENVLRVMLRAFAALPVEGERLMKEIRQQTALSGAEGQFGLDELTAAGIVCTVRKLWNEHVYFVPIDGFVIWQQALFPCEGSPLPASEKAYMLNGEIIAARRPLGRQLLSAFSVLARSGMELTAKGALTKKTIVKMVQAVDFDEQLLQAFGLNWAMRDYYCLTAAFILEAGCASGLLYTDKGRLNWDDGLLSNWLTQDEVDRERQLLAWCLRLLLKAGGESAHIVAAIHKHSDGQWYSVDAVEQWYGIFFSNSRTSALGEKDKEQPDWFALFNHFGWLELVNYEKEGVGNRLFRWTFPIAGGTKGTNNSVEKIIKPEVVSIQPNGECIVDAGCSFAIRWEMELLAERVSDEHVTVYRMDANTIARALELGRTRASIRSFLEALSGGQALTSAVEAMLELWTSRACRTAFSEVILLRCDNEQMGMLVQQNERMKPYLLQQLSPTDFIVDKMHISELRGLLNKAGYPPRKGIQSAELEEKSDYPFLVMPDGSCPLLSSIESSNLRNAFVYETYSLQHFEWVAVIDKNMDKRVEQWGSVPAMWTKQLRAYHHSTRKELMEQALQWQTPVQLRLERGLRSFVPERLEGIKDSWAVVGLLRDESEQMFVRLTPDMWQEMRIVIPGQTDPI